MQHDAPRADRWARLRFSIVGPLLAAPPARGDLKGELRTLSQKTWRHPITGEPLSLAVSTIERWYYAAKNERRDPVGVLKRRVRKDAGAHPSLSGRLRQALLAQYRDHRRWSYQLHADNLRALGEGHPDLGSVPSYSTVRRYMVAHGLLRERTKRPEETPAGERAETRLLRFEVRSFEADYVHGLWHADFHVGHRKVLTPRGEWATPHLFAATDDRSRLACHLQWYLGETAETFFHGLSQAFQKRGLPRALMTDNGSAMIAAETQEGLHDFSITHEPTLDHSPYQNAKVEAFWGSAEGRLMAMLEGVADLTLDTLNEATQAWVEMEYNREVHSEIGVPPLDRFLAGPTVGRDSPSSDALRRAFRLRTTRTQRRSDGTISIEGRRFEVPSAYRHVRRLAVRYARWDLSSVDLTDERTGAILSPLYPLDKSKNADGRRRLLDPLPAGAAAPGSDPKAARAAGIAPLLKKLIDEYRSSGLPPAYIPHPSPATESPKEVTR